MIFIVFIIFLLLLHKGKISANKLSIILIVLLASGIFANRSLSVPDTIPYLNMYEGSGTDNYELGYIYICEFFNNLGFSFKAFLFVISFVSLAIWFFITKKITSNKYIYLAFIIYLSYMGIYYHGIVLRSCLAILINYIGIYYGLVKNRSLVFFYICVLVSCLFHFSAILFAPLPFIIQRKYNIKLLYIVIIGSFFFLLLNNNISLLTDILSAIMDKLFFYGGSRLGGYIEKADTATLSLTHIKYLITAVVLVYLSNYIKQDFLRKEKFNVFFNTYIIGIVLLFLFSFAPGSARIAQLFLFFEFIPFILLYEGIDKSKGIYMKLFLFVLVVMNILNLYSLAPALWNYCS